MKIQPLAATLGLLAFSFPATADTFLMKDGSTMEGTVIRETPDSYVIEVNVTKTIKDERTVAKADVSRIKREKLDLTAFEEIEKLSPAPDLLTPAEYEAMIKQVEKFLDDHRGSSKTRQAKEILATLKKEANEVLAGGIKMNGAIISPAEYRANAYDIDARVGEKKIRDLVAELKYLQALREFSEFETEFRNTSAFNSLIPLMGQVITAYLAETKQTLAGYDARLKRRNVGLERMTNPDRRVTENAIKEENRLLEVRYNNEKAARVGWVTPHPFFKPSLEETLNYGAQQMSRLEAAQNSPEVDGGKAYRDVLLLIKSNGDSTAVSTAIAAAKSAKVAPRYIEILESTAQGAGLIP